MSLPLHTNGQPEVPTTEGTPGAKPGEDARGSAVNPSRALHGRVVLLGGGFEGWQELIGPLSREGIDVKRAAPAMANSEVIDEVQRDPAVVLIDLAPDLEQGMAAVAVCRSAAPEVPVVVLATNPSLETARRLRLLGVFYLAVHPLDGDEIRNVLAEAFRALAEKRVNTSSCRTKKILVVDDDADFRNSVTALLEAEGYSVCSAASGREGLSKVVSEKPDLVVLDIMMESQWSGYEVSERIKFQSEDETTRSIPVLMVSSIQEHPFERFQTAIEAGMICPDDYMTKPLEVPAFLAKVRQLLGGGC